ncbi:MAG: diaminopimelate epimerase [Chloroflexota bacterium]|nr:diaminopimelate epimerase [Chloroflexota bacterium]
MPFWKMSGSGNDFIVIDAWQTTLPEDLPAFVRAVCHRRHGVGADGIVLIHPAGPDAGDPAPDVAPDQHPGAGGAPDPRRPGPMTPVLYRWQYLNADGTEGEFCGNGAMCGARFAAHHGLAPFGIPFAFWTAAGRTEATVERDGGVRLLLAPPGPVGSPVRVEVAGVGLDLHPIIVGVPHAVLVAGSMDAPTAALVRERFVAVGRAVRRHPAFAPAGTNLDLADVCGEHEVRMRTYERGVEDETLACGSGAVAVALVTAALGLTRLPVRVETSGGPTLTVAGPAGPAGPDGSGRVTLGGEARLVASGTIHLDGLTGCE